MPKKHKKSSSRSHDEGSASYDAKASDTGKSSDGSGEESIGDDNIYGRCQKCGLTFTTKYDHDKHMNRIYPCVGKKHGNSGKKRTTQDKKTKKKQVYRRDADGKYVCDTCITKKKEKRTFSNLSNYKKHVNSAKHKKNVTLVKEGIDIASENLSVDNETFSCEICPLFNGKQRTFLTLGNYKKHLDSNMHKRALNPCANTNNDVKKTRQTVQNKRKVRYVSDANKQIILERQNHKCANNPDANLYRIGDFPCVLWEGTRKGVFMESGYEFDHVIEFSLTQENNISSLQALCHS